MSQFFFFNFFVWNVGSQYKYPSKYSLYSQQCKNQVQLKSILRSETPFHISQIMKKQKQKTQIYKEKNLTTTTTIRATTHCYANLCPPRRRLKVWHGLQVLSSKNVWFIFKLNSFIYIVWLDLISGFDCFMGEKNPKLSRVETINPEQRQGDRELEFHRKKSSILWG